MTTQRRRPARPRAAPRRIGLALAGGGPLGGIYEVGALLALADSIEGLDLNALDVYVGVSSGGFVAAALANGLSPSQMYRLFIDEGSEAAMKPALFLRPALREFARRATTLPEGVTLLLCVNPLVPFDATQARRRGATGAQGLDHGGLPRVLAQTFRAIIRSRMQAGMAAYAREYPDADVLLFEPAREDAAMFSANIFGYAQRARMCPLAYAATRADLRARAGTLAPVLHGHGLALDNARLADDDRRVTDALCDARPLRTEPRRRRIGQATRDLAHALDHLERQLAAPR